MMYWDEKTPNISAIGDALVALEAEVEKLDQDASMMFRQLLHITAKQRICLAALVKHLEKINGGTYPDPCPHAEFPELNHQG